MSARVGSGRIILHHRGAFYRLSRLLFFSTRFNGGCSGHSSLLPPPVHNPVEQVTQHPGTAVVIPFPAQRQAGVARVTRGIQASTGTDGLRRVTQNPSSSSLQDKQLKQDVPEFAPGDTVVVQVKVTEGDRERLQAYEGIVVTPHMAGVWARRPA